MILLAALGAASTLVVGVVVILALRQLRSMRAQLVGLTLMAVALPLGAVIFSGLVMLDRREELGILFLAAAAAAPALAGARLLARSTLGGVERLRRASAELSSGDLAARAPEDGPRELAQLGASFNEMARSVEELFDARRQLVAWASHDLRTPISAMRAMIEALEDGLAEPHHYLPALGRQVETLGRLVDDLFELARIDAGALTLELSAAHAAAMVDSCLESLDAEARSRGISLVARVSDGVPAVLCAPDHVRRILMNLLVNALRHTPSDGSVAVVVEQPGPGGEVCFSVQDTGAGMSADALRRAFERFWRGDQARSEPGAGLGLAIARGLVEAQGGRVWADNGPEGGARVSFTLPAAPA